MSKEDKKARKRAVALRYEDERDRAPKVVAKGAGYIADRIIEVAAEHGIVLYEDKEMTKLLSQVDLHVEIPGELYQAVAKVLAFVYQLDGRLSGDTRR